MKIKAYPIIARAVEEGVDLGWNRAHKHTSSPEESLIKEQIVDAVISELSDVIDFDPEVECGIR